MLRLSCQTSKQSPKWYFFITNINPVFLMFVFKYSNIFTEPSAPVTLLQMQDNDSCTHKHNPNALPSRMAKTTIYMFNLNLESSCLGNPWPVGNTVQQLFALNTISPRGFWCHMPLCTPLFCFSISASGLHFFLQAFRLPIGCWWQIKWHLKNVCFY